VGEKLTPPWRPAYYAGPDYEVPDDAYGDEFGPDGEDGDPWDDCGLMPDGQCTKAGSEECDWDCGRLHRRALTKDTPDHG
jgi:hypothetical protein